MDANFNNLWPTKDAPITFKKKRTSGNLTLASNDFPPLTNLLNLNKSGSNNYNSIL